jgi:hypothetical protein
VLQSARLPRRRRRHRAMVRWAARRGRVGSVGPCAAPGTAMPPPCSPSPRASRVHAAPPNQQPHRRTRPAPTHVAAAPLPMPRPVLPPLALVCKQTFPPTQSSAIKAHHRPSREGAQRHQATIATASGATENPVLRPCCCQNRATNTFPRTDWSSHTRLLSRPGRRLAGARPPATAAASVRRAHLLALSPPRVRTQIDSLRLLEPPQPLPRPSPASNSPDFGQPRAPLVQGPHCETQALSRVFCADQGYGCEASDLSRVQFTKTFLTPLSVSAATCKIHNKSQKNPKIANPILLCSV